jgi:hypothetical protein
MFVMKRWLVVPLLTLLAPDFVWAQDTAYKALKTIGTQRGEKALNQVVSITGNSGHSQPVSWNVSLSDPGARAGVRELQITSGVISSERAPARNGNADVPINLSKLNVDSDGAFRAAEEEARRNQVAFDSVNYRLTSNGATGAPVWRLDLIDTSGNPVGTVKIAADSGSLVSGENWLARGGSRTAQEQSNPSYDSRNGPPPRYDHPTSDYRDPSYQDHPSESNSDDHSGESIGSRTNRYGATVVHFGEKVADKTVRAARKVGGWFQKKFTGQDTLNDDQHDESDDQPAPPSSSDPYNQPVRPTTPD